MTTSYRTEGGSVRASGGWARLSSELTSAVEWPSGRRDLVVSVAPGAGHGSKACFSPDRAWIEIDADVTGISEKEAGDLKPAFRWNDREKIPGAWGLLVHEAAHSAHTRWTRPVIADLIRQRSRPDLLRYFEAAKLLEEVRIEYKQSRKRWWDTRWLRMSASQHLLADIDPEGGLSDRVAAARVYTLVGGRVKAGILEEKETAPVLAAAVAALDGPTVKSLDSIIERVIKVSDTDGASMMNFGEQWVNAVGAPPVSDEMALAMLIIMIGADPEDGDGDGDGDEGESSGAGDAGQSGDTSEGGEGDGTGSDDAGAGDEAKPQPDSAGPGGPAKPEKPQSEMAKKIAQAVEEMVREIEKDGGTLMIGYTGRRGDFKPTWRNVEPASKLGAAALARRLREYYLPERSATRHDTTLPPGRLSTREVIRGRAQEWAGQMPDVTPWRSVSRKMVQTPPLRVGIAVDVSGSMSHLADHSRELAYRLSAAFAALPDSRVRTIAAGEGIAAWEMRPGKVPHFGYSHGEQNVHKAIEDLAERLQLYRRGNARLLVIISDGGFNNEEEDGTRDQVAHLVRSGCRVLWLNFDSFRHYGYSMSSQAADQRPDAISGLAGVDYVLLDSTEGTEAVMAMAEAKLVTMLTAGMRAA